MKFTQTLIASAVLLATSSIALAADDTKTLQINVTQGEFVNLVGTAFTAAHDFASSDMDGTDKSLGNLGIDSNLTGACTLTFSSAHGYQLNLNNSPTGAKLVDYELAYNGVAVPAVALPTTCQAAELPLTFKSTSALPAENAIAAGTYSDVVTIVVATVL